MTITNQAVKAFTTMMKAGSLDGIVLYDLIETYKCAEEGELRDALRKVIRAYSNYDQYEQFKKEVRV